MLRTYLRDRHPGGGMTGMEGSDFADMISMSPVDTVVVEYREPAVDGRPGRLVGACLTDKQSDGLSMVYSFYDTGPDARPGLGTFMILDHVVRAAQVGMRYVYLGYWVDGSARMQYKIRYRPLEKLGPNGWERFDPGEQTRLIARTAATGREDAAAVDGSGKDGVPGGQDQYQFQR